MNSDTIIDLLHQKHKNDVFVCECKDGSTWFGHNRLDAWAMKKSWVHPCMYGYEIKVSRSDFLRDNKWLNYLPLCNMLYFVSTTGIIDPSELGEGVGLLTVASTGSSLRTIRKASFREIEPPADLLKYLLMYRTRICASTYGCDQESSKAEFWRAWMAKKKQDCDFGNRVSRKLRQIVAKQIEEVSIENRKLKAENERLESVKRVLESLNVPLYPYDLSRSIRDQVHRLRMMLPETTMRTIEALKGQLSQIIEDVDKWNKEHGV